jgi:hypothetical protein
MGRIMQRRMMLSWSTTAHAVGEAAANASSADEQTTNSQWLTIEIDEAAREPPDRYPVLKFEGG